MQQTSSPMPADDGPAAERQHAADDDDFTPCGAAPLSEAPTCLTASTTLSSSDDDSSTSSSPLHARLRQSHHYAVANSITGCFSDVSRRYSVDFSRVLGAGTGTTVCECEDLATGEQYAVKIVAKGRRRLRGAKSRDLHREVSLLRDLRDGVRGGGSGRSTVDEEEKESGRCGGVIELVDLHEDTHNLHIVTELCRGGELFDRINDRIAEHRRLRAQGVSVPRCFSEHDASAVLRQVLSALDFLHSHDICHRDVKPENILFLHPEGAGGPGGDDAGLAVRLADLGLARYHHASSFEPRMSTVVGTCTFIAPEVLRRRYDRRCDHWSLGIVAYMMVCGYPPFVGGSNGEVCDAVLKGRYRFDPRHWGNVSKEAKGFVRGLLKVNVKSRIGGEAAMAHPFIAGGGARDEGVGEGGGPLGRYSAARIRRSIFRL